MSRSIVQFKEEKLSFEGAARDSFKKILIFSVDVRILLAIT
jgi:hypothetical protein